MSALRPTDPNIMDIIFGQLRDLGRMVGRLDEKNDRRFDLLDRKFDEVTESTDKRLTELETDSETAKAVARALGKREVRATDKRRHWINLACGLLGAVLATGVGELLSHWIH